MIPGAYAVKDKEEDLESEYDFEKEKHIKWYDQVLMNRPAKVVGILILTAVVAPLLLYRFLFFTTRDLAQSDGFSVGSCLFPRNQRLPCGIGYMTELECHQQCCFDPGNNFCFHRLPSRFTYIMDRNWTEDTILQPRVSTVPYALQKSKTNLKLSIDEQSSTHLTLSFYDSRLIALIGKKVENKSYVYKVASPELDVVVNSTQGTIFNTARGPLIASNNIWEITFQLTNETMYGLGELPLKPGHTKVLYNHNGGLNSIPLIFAKINESYHGLLIDAVSSTEVSVQGNNNIVVRSITNTGLRLHLFVGPRPKDIMKDAITLLGHTNNLEYWMLGAHICSEISTSETIQDKYENLRKFIYNASSEKLPYESHCGTRPIVFNSDDCDIADTEYIQKGINLLKEVGKRFVPHISPYIRFDKNLTVSDESNNKTQSDEDCYKIVSDNKDLFYRREASSELYEGLVRDERVLYPSYEDNSENFLRKLWTFNGSVDGIILENSWPLDQSNKTYDNITYLPYFSQNISKAFEDTPPWNLILINNSQMYLQNHNIYGNQFAKAFHKMFNRSLPTWSSSQWMNTKLVTNRQNINALWSNLHHEIIQAALGGISGNWLWASPVCGDTDYFNLNTQANLCVKWYMANTFLPVLKVHSKGVSRDPLAFVGTQKRLIMAALKRRLSLLPYFYTTLQEGPLLRPMFYQFPTADYLANINTQFSVGDDLLIVPNLEPLQKFVHFWLPPGVWYELWSGLRLRSEIGQATTMSTTEADFLTIIRGGSIMVMQKDTKETAEETRLHSSISLTIALECENNGSECVAAGQVFVAVNTTIFFEATENKLNVSMNGDHSIICDANKAIFADTVKEIYVFGLDEKLNNFDHHKHLETSINLCNLESNEFSLR